MFPRPRLMFLQNKIMELQQALFFNESDAVLKLSTSLINVLQVDDADQIWFIVNRPAQNLNEFEKEFRARCDFYKKGKDFYLQVIGKACIVTDPEEINNVHGLDSETKALVSSSMVLIRMKITKTFYYPIKKQAPLQKPVLSKLSLHPSTIVKSLQYIIKDIIPVFQSQ